MKLTGQPDFASARPFPSPPTEGGVGRGVRLL